MESGAAPTNEELAKRLETLEQTQDWATRLRTLELAAQNPARDLSARIQSLETTYDLVGRVSTATAEIDNLIDRISALEADRPDFSQRQLLLHEHAAAWLRLVNQNIWTLNSIFLLGAIIAFSNAHAANAEWKHIVGWGIAAVCVVWLFADISYSISAKQARVTLAKLESHLSSDDEKLYRNQTVSWRGLILWGALISSYIVIIGIGYIAIMKFVLAT